MLCTVTLLLRWQPSKIGLTSFNVVARRFLMSHAQVPRKRLPRRTTWQKSTISYRKTITGLYYAELLGRFDAELQKKWPHLAKKKSAFPPRQRTGSHLRRRHSQIGRIRLRTAAPSTVFSRFGHVRLLFVSKLEKVTRRAEIWVEWGDYRRHGGLLCRPPKNVFFRRVKEVGASPGQVYRAKRRLRREINRHFSNVFVFLL